MKTWFVLLLAVLLIGLAEPAGAAAAPGSPVAAAVQFRLRPAAPAAAPASGNGMGGPYEPAIAVEPAPEAGQGRWRIRSDPAGERRFGAGRPRPLNRLVLPF